MSINPQQIGDCSIKLAPKYPRFQFRNGLGAAHLLFRGMYADCAIMCDSLVSGQSFTDYLAARWGLDDWDLIPDKGMKGMASVPMTFTDWVSMSVPIVEVMFTDLSKDIITNAFFTTGAAALVSDDLVALTMWKNETDWAAKKAFGFHNPPGAANPVTPLSDNAVLAAKKILAGTTSYNTSYPIIRGTEYYRTPQTVTKGWVRANPPGNYRGVPTGYEWVLGAQRMTFDRRNYILYPAYIGADSWDHDLYPSAE